MPKQENIFVTKSFLPPIKEYTSYLQDVYRTGWLTNNGKYVVSLEERLREKLGIKNFLYCANGTIVLDMALKSLDLTKEIITTPYSYVATLNSILWRGCKPVFADINEGDFNINPECIEPLITQRTEAILATHVYGNPCDVDAIQKIAKKYKLKVIYDAAHAFNVRYKNKQVLSFGDISTCSFHATKVFHTIEGGGISTNDYKLFNHLYKQRQFGHIQDDYYEPGINAKNSEFHAIMGHCVLNHIDEIIESRKETSLLYDTELNPAKIKRPQRLKGVEYNYAYYPVVFENEKKALFVMSELAKENIFPRRYFYPSLNTLPFVKYRQCPVSEAVSVSVLSLPLYYGLSRKNVIRICRIINKNV